MIYAHDMYKKLLECIMCRKRIITKRAVCLNFFTGNSVLSLAYTASVGNNNTEQICATAEMPTSRPPNGNTIVSLTCVQPLVGQYLRISRAQSVIDLLQEKKHNNLILCEVIVWGVIATYIRQGM